MAGTNKMNPTTESRPQLNTDRLTWARWSGRIVHVCGAVPERAVASTVSASIK
jgi:hypothetical protein